MQSSSYAVVLSLGKDSLSLVISRKLMFANSMWWSFLTS